MLVEVLTRVERLLGPGAPYMLWVHQRPAGGDDWPAAHLHLHLAPALRAPGVVRHLAAAEFGAGVFSIPSIRGRPRHSCGPHVRVSRAGPPDAAQLFAERYGREPEGVWFAPGRVNLIGGPDYNEVFVLPFALGAGVFAAASRRSDRRIALTSRHAGGEPVLLAIDTLEPASAAAGPPIRPGWPGRFARPATWPAAPTWRSTPTCARAPGSRPRRRWSARWRSRSPRSTRCLYPAVISPPCPTGGERLRRRAHRDHRPDSRDACPPDHALQLDCRSGTETAIPLDPAAAACRWW